MPDLFSRRRAIGLLAGGATLTNPRTLSGPASGSIHTQFALKEALKGHINHSVCQWCYDKIPLMDLAKAAKGMGIKSVELLTPGQWRQVQTLGLTCAMGYPDGPGADIERGFNDPTFHDALVQSYETAIPLAAKDGIRQLICFSGNRGKLTDEQGLANCATALKRIMPTAEKHGVTIAMELLNSKIDHKDYQCDHTAWGVDLCKRVGSDRFRLLYDIYHMQIMEGDIIRTIQDNHPYISHYHTGGVPGRHEIDQTQELNYPAIMQAIVKTGYTGFVGQEFIPARDPLASLRQSITICDV